MRLNKQYYFNAKSERKLNCYHVHLSKEVVSKSGLDEDDELAIYNDYDKIIIEKKYHCTCMECGYEWNTGKAYSIQSACPKCKVGDIHYDINGGNNDNQNQRTEKDA